MTFEERVTHETFGPSGIVTWTRPHFLAAVTPALAEWLAGEIDKWWGGVYVSPQNLKARLGLPLYDKPAKPEVDVGTEVRKCALEVKDVIWKLADRLEEE